MKGYCMKCKATREIKDPVEAMTKNGRKMVKGTCPECGTKMNKFISSK